MMNRPRPRPCPFAFAVTNGSNNAPSTKGRFAAVVGDDNKRPLQKDLDFSRTNASTLEICTNPVFAIQDEVIENLGELPLVHLNHK